MAAQKRYGDDSKDWSFQPASGAQKRVITVSRKVTPEDRFRQGLMAAGGEAGA